MSLLGKSQVSAGSLRILWGWGGSETFSDIKSVLILITLGLRKLEDTEGWLQAGDLGPDEDSDSQLSSVGVAKA